MMTDDDWTDIAHAAWLKAHARRARRREFFWFAVYLMLGLLILATILASHAAHVGHA